MLLLSRLLIRRGVPRMNSALRFSFFSASVGDHRTMILKPAERDMAESDFQFRIKKEAELNEVVVLLAHTLRNQHGTVVLRGRHPNSILMSLKAVTASAYRASKQIDLTFRGPPTEWPTPEQREEFERWAGMEAGNEIWIGAKISTRGHPADHRG
ncbi:hypothetical protein FOZ62_013112, partial [Perkinsus olseni]